MSSPIPNPKEFWSGVMFTAFGLATVFIGRDYAMGSAGHMGPGYFPTMLGGLLTLLGLLAVARSLLKAGEGIEKFAFKEAGLVLLSVLLFAVMVRGAGLLAAVFVMVMMSAYASAKFEVKSTMLLAVGGAASCSLVFVKWLGVPMPIIGPWFGY